MSPHLKTLHERIEPLRQQLASHRLYTSIRSLSDLNLFMQSHVFAVWDFMSLLKALQRSLTWVEVPWQPTQDAVTRRFLNEIVLGEESDSCDGRTFSHFELYLEAMQQCGADTAEISRFLRILRSGASVTQAMDWAGIPIGASRFVGETFAILDSESLPAIAAAFAFGREDVIPEMFRSFVRELNSSLSGRVQTFLFYLERHIEMDGDDHGPLALRMIENICGDDPLRWNEAEYAAERALRARIHLWDSIDHLVHSQQSALTSAV